MFRKMYRCFGDATFSGIEMTFFETFEE